jgi:hypothetical protein
MRRGDRRLRAGHRARPSPARSGRRHRRAPPTPIPPAGFAVVIAPPPGGLGAALVGQRLLYWWPGEGWQRGNVARLCKRGALSHVVAYTRQTLVCAARPTRCLTLRHHDTVPDGRSSPRLLLPGYPDPCGPTPLGLNLEFGRRLAGHSSGALPRPGPG